MTWLAKHWKDVFVGIALIIIVGATCSAWRADSAYRRITAERDSLAARIVVLDSRVAKVDTIYKIARARTTAARDTARQATDTALAHTTVTAKACPDSAVLIAQLDTVGNMLADERLKSDSLTSVVTAAHDSLVVIDSLRTLDQHTAQAALNDALQHLQTPSPWVLSVTGGLDIHGKPNLVAGVGYSIPIPFLHHHTKLTP